MKRWTQALRLMGVGWYIAFCIIFGLLFGLWVDGKTHTRPLFTLIGLVMSIATAFLGVYRMVLYFVKENRDKGDD
ncbi:MAG: hypothetical protein A2Y60_07305 [Chloroflexi bacterium RBG_13_54_9]|nr:MAG: hypothetical protein A2Y60_07305 [Chloroflexi bacterium RBG_13_54_9]